MFTLPHICSFGIAYPPTVICQVRIHPVSTMFNLAFSNVLAYSLTLGGKIRGEVGSLFHFEVNFQGCLFHHWWVIRFVLGDPGDDEFLKQGISPSVYQGALNTVSDTSSSMRLLFDSQLREWVKFWVDHWVPMKGYFSRVSVFQKCKTKTTWLWERSHDSEAIFDSEKSTTSSFTVRRDWPRCT